MSWETKKACGPKWRRKGGHRGTTDTHGTWMPPGGPPLNFELGLLLSCCCACARGDWRLEPSRWKHQEGAIDFL